MSLEPLSNQRGLHEALQPVSPLVTGELRRLLTVYEKSGQHASRAGVKS